MAGRGGKKDKARKTLAYASLGIALLGGAATAITPVGGAVAEDILGIFSSWVPLALFAVGLVVAACDTFDDGEPNQLALYMAIVLPTIARALTGKLGHMITDGSRDVVKSVTGPLGEWVGPLSTFGLAVVSVFVSLAMARTVIARRGGGRPAAIPGGGGR